MQRSVMVSLGVALAAVLGLAWYVADADASGNPSEAAATNSAVASSNNLAGVGIATNGLVVASRGPLSLDGERNRAAQLALWQSRYQRAELTYAHYRDATRYPHESRPLAEHPDQVRPFAAISEDNLLRDANGTPIKGLKLRTIQERVFASGADTVQLSVQALGEKDTALPLTIISASANSVAESKVLAQAIRTNINFADNGQGAGVYSARLSPKDQGFASYAGTVRVIVQLSANGQSGAAQFDVIYSPEAPATWGGIREVIEAGSLNFYVKAQVNRAGRYVASARVDDANGAPFALLQFNEELASGSREFKMQVFGALVHDKRPVFPLRVRDVEGFLLIADKFPDRAMMPRQVGVVHTSRRYTLDNFASSEWTSEERERYLAEYARDADLARVQLDRLLTQ